MHTLTKAEIEDAAARVDHGTRARCHQAIVSGKRDQAGAEREFRFWLTALEKAERQLKMSAVDGARLTTWWPTDDPRHFGFESSSANKPYTASLDTCECEAFKHGNPCWHRMAVAILLDALKHRPDDATPATPRQHSPFTRAELEAAAAELFA